VVDFLLMVCLNGGYLTVGLLLACSTLQSITC